MKLLVVLTSTLLVATALSLPTAEFIQGTRNFTANLYKELTNKTNNNIVFSPITIQTILSLLASASSDENHLVVTEIRDAANLPSTEQQRRQDFTSVLNSLSKTDNDFKAFDATKMYFGQGYSVEPWYRDVAKKTYNAEIETVSFDDPSIYRTINQWIANKTNNKILNVLDSNDLSSNTKNVLISTLYLMGKWDKPFEQKNNVNKIFTSPYYSSKTVEMMTSFQSYDYHEDTFAQYLKLEMVREKGGAEMVFVLPKNRDDTLDSSNIDHILQNKSFENEQVKVTLPKFSITTDMKLKETLQNLGMTELFEWQEETGGITYPGNPFVIINDVFQKVYIDVDEWGVYGASVVIGEAEVDSSKYEPKIFTADHPFFYYVTVDKMVVFAGRVMQIET